ncbi:VOC family protein [Paenibacillus beijingensis]|uniref:VOC domain-containing protein n=1 Tax=Paenibacillus beijingensis TaxID=1126833 RepID=A0A0D5NJA7_9BACL|nr:VOC family protein [Paenibacillus beijingensis]AJY75082.1 hypothetical protein VN24_11455 [Paenibacillus beijingensis]
MHSFKGLAHIGLYSGDVEETINFYTSNFDFQVVNERTIEKPDHQWVKVAMLALNGMTLEVIEHSDKSLHKTGNGGCVDHVAIEVENLPEIVTAIRAKGHQFRTEEPVVNMEMLGGARYIYLSGPSGESIELFELLSRNVH